VFVDDLEASISELFDQNTLGTAVASIEDVRELTDTGWEILGTTGPIAVS